MPKQFFIDRLCAVAREHGPRPALLVDGEVKYTYQQLWKAAGEVAAELQSQGIGRESLVGIQLPRSPDFVVTMVGVWRAGAAYLPLDPTLPSSRLDFMVNDSSAQVVVTDVSKLLSRSTSIFQPPSLSDEDLAYVIYTSGSTGRPKGVAVEQRGLVGLLDAQIEAFQLTPESRVFFLLSTSFDASISDIGTTLLAGAALCIESKHQGQGMVPSILADLLHQRRITHIDIPPALLALMDESPLPLLQTIVIGGEPCRADVVRSWARRHRVVNVYGPTEATICTSLGVCDPDTWDRPLLGQPIAGIDYRIDRLEQRQEGELLISGHGLARGYINDKELTNSRFVVIEKQRWYRTGDLVRYDADGEYVFLGRLDRQLKLRGNRIEPEEIETALASVPGVSRCAVIARPVSTASTRQLLVAFVVTGQKDVEPTSLRTQLAQSLPDWMIPQRIEFVDELPVTTSGKIDFAHLQTVSLAPLATPATQTRLEQQLVEVWQTVLGVPCGLEDDFFDLGGNSLAMLEVIALAKARGLEITPTLIASERSIAGIRNKLLTACAVDSTNALSADALRQDIHEGAAQLRAWTANRKTPTTPPSDDCRILLTGATGFLGCRVLEQLLSRTKRRIVCLVRAPNQASALCRLRETCAAQQLVITDSDFSRIDVMNGDVANRDLGLRTDEWDQLAATTEAIYHCAARVHLLEQYSQLRSVNVTGLVEILRLATSGPRKQIHYASTLSVLVGTDGNRGRLLESDDLSETEMVFGGYAQSKWAAEVLLRRADLPPDSWTAFRFGLLAIDSRTGRTPQDDLLGLAVRGLDNWGRVPKIAPQVRFDLTPVDFAAAAMVYLSLLPAAKRHSSTYHLANPHSVSFEQLIRCLKQVRPELKEVEPHVFLEWVEDSTDGLQATACLALCQRLASRGDWTEHRQLDLFQATGVEFDTTHASQDLQGSGILCPPSDDPMVTFLLRRILD